MSGVAGWAWRRWRAFGGEVCSPTFDTPQEAGDWRGDREHLTLVAIGEDGRTYRASPQEVGQAIAAMGARA